jgi:hypothetical protein
MVFRHNGTFMRPTGCSEREFSTYGRFSMVTKHIYVPPHAARIINKTI